MKQLSASDFELRGGVLHAKLGGAALILFTVGGCEGCKNFLPVVSRYARSDNRITSAVINLDDHRVVGKMSRGTTTVIDRVPHLIIYFNGNPYAKFTGKRDVSSVGRFVAGAIAKAPTNSFVPEGGTTEEYAEVPAKVIPHNMPWGSDLKRYRVGV